MTSAFLHPRKAPLPSRAVFLRHLGRQSIMGAALLLVSLGLGVAGYHYVASLSWVDALLNASMILTGMGPVDRLTTTGAKVFASVYALFAGVAFLTIMATVLSPLVHRFLHRFHLETEKGEEPGEARPRPSPAP